LAASIPAGLLAKRHMQILEDGETQQANVLENDKN